MQTLYKAEFFDRDMNYVSGSITPITKPRIVTDYLTLESYDVTAPRTPARKGDFVRISDHYGDVVVDGIVNDVYIDGGTTNINILPLLSLCDIMVDYDRTILQNNSVEFFLKYVLEKTYKTNADVLQNLPGLEVVTTSETRTTLNIKSNVHDLWDICSRSLTVYGVAINSVLDIGNKTIRFTIGKIGKTRTIEADLKNCLSKTVNFGDSFGATNKATYINKSNETQRVTYYLHTDGSVDTADRDRVTPVFFTTEYVETEDDFQAEAYSRAMDSLTPEKYDNLIELTYRRDDNLVHPKTMNIGEITNILIDETLYESILTGIEIEGELYKLIFGKVRIDLTKQLMLERRKANANQN